MVTLNVTLLLRAILFGALIALMVLQWIDCKRFAEPFAWLMVGVNGLLYVVVISIDRTLHGGVINANAYNIWSAALIIQFLLTLIVIEWMRYQRIRGRRGC